MTSFRLTPEQAKKLSTAEQYEWFRRATSRRNLLRGGIAGAGASPPGRSSAGPRTPRPRHVHRADPVPPRPARRPASPPPRSASTLPSAPNPADSIAVGWQVRDAVSNPYLRVRPSVPGHWGQKIERRDQGPGHAQGRHRRRSTRCRWSTRPRSSSTTCTCRSRQPAAGRDLLLHASATTAGTRPATSASARSPPRRRPAAVHLHRLRRPGRHLRRGRHRQPDPRPRTRPSTCTRATSPTPRTAATA